MTHFFIAAFVAGIVLYLVYQSITAPAAAGRPSTVAPRSAAGDGTYDDVAALAGAGRKIEAIKLYRELAGVGLKEAKEAVEAIEAGRTPPPVAVSPAAAPSHPEPPADLEAECRRLYRAGKAIAAIKLYREHTGVGLKEAKEAVEALAEP